MQFLQNIFKKIVRKKTSSKVSNTKELPKIIMNNGEQGDVFGDYNYRLYDNTKLKYKELYTLLSEAVSNEKLINQCKRLKTGMRLSWLSYTLFLAIMIIFLLQYFFPYMMMPVPSIELLYCSEVSALLGLTAQQIIEAVMTRKQQIAVDNYNLELLHIRDDDYPELILHNDILSRHTYRLHKKTQLTYREVYNLIAAVQENGKLIKRIKLLTGILCGLGLFLIIFSIGCFIPRIYGWYTVLFGSFETITYISLVHIQGIFAIRMLRKIQLGTVEKGIDNYNAEIIGIEKL